jgi:hypothetical protein
MYLSKNGAHPATALHADYYMATTIILFKNKIEEKRDPHRETKSFLAFTIKSKATNRTGCSTRDLGRQDKQQMRHQNDALD